MHQPKIDEIDAKILKTLLKNARTSFPTIAKECGVTNVLIHKRFESLKKSGVIIGTSIITAPKDTMNFSLIVELKVEESHIQSMIASLKEMPEILNVYPVAGKYDIHVVFKIESYKQRDTIRNLLASKKGITKIKFLSVDRAFAFYPENLVLNYTDE